jgi:anti-repressor protein
MSPTPPRQPGWTCDCGSWNESDRTICRNCQTAGGVLVPFEFPVTGHPVRTVMVDGQPWFVAVDVATILGYANTRKAINDHVPARHQKGNDSFPLADLGLHPQTKLISEAGLYRLVMRSDVPLAEPFQDWVTDDVLPAIRETGSYSVARQHEIPQSFAEALELAARQAREIESVRAENAELKPSAHAWDVLASGKGDHAVADAAKILSRDPAITIGRDRLFAYMAGLGWVHRQRADNRWRAYQRHVDNGRLSEIPQPYENPKTHEVTLGAPQVRVKAKGLHDLHQKLGGTAPLDLRETENA